MPLRFREGLYYWVDAVKCPIFSDDMDTRRNFLEKSVLATAAATILPSTTWAKGFRTSGNNDLKLSLAQWSLHRGQCLPKDRPAAGGEPYL